MSQYFESIRAINGRIMNVSYHQKRLDRTSEYLSCKTPNLRSLLEHVNVPAQGVYKIRLSFYEGQLISKSINSYKEKSINTLQLIEFPINYSFKWENRNTFNQAFAQKGKADDVIILKSGFLTDSTYCNIALYTGNEWITPKNCLLRGTTREKLLDRRILREGEIHYTDLSSFEKIRLFNALIPWYKKKELSINNIYSVQ